MGAPTWVFGILMMSFWTIVYWRIWYIAVPVTAVILFLLVLLDKFSPEHWNARCDHCVFPLSSSRRRNFHCINCRGWVHIKCSYEKQIAAQCVKET